LGAKFCFITEISFGEHRYKQKQKPTFDLQFVAYGKIIAFGEVAVLLPLLWWRLCKVSETTAVQ